MPEIRTGHLNLCVEQNPLVKWALVRCVSSSGHKRNMSVIARGSIETPLLRFH